jgi:2-oxoglutaroyl-CoA hydrolase
VPLTGGEVKFAKEYEGQVAALTLSRPEKMNAVTWEMRAKVAEHFSVIDADSDIKVVLIRGEGDNFSPGGDIPGFLELEPHEFSDLGKDLTSPARSPKPVVAAIDGHCLGAGLELAMSCDIRVATARSSFGQPEMRLGMIPGSGGTQRLARLIGLSRSKYLIMTAQNFSAQQAEQWGLVATVVEDREELACEVDRIIRRLMEFSPLALKTAKEVLDRGTDGPLETGIELERKAYAMLRSSWDFQEGVRAFVEKRPPSFKGS